jgi:hypothetical protein
MSPEIPIIPTLEGDEDERIGTAEPVPRAGQLGDGLDRR